MIKIICLGKIKEKYLKWKRTDTGQKGLRMYEINICRCSP